MLIGGILTTALLLAISPVPLWGPGRYWTEFLETRRLGIDLLVNNVPPDRSLVLQNRTAYDRLMEEGEIVDIGATANQVDALTNWMRSNGIEQFEPLDVLMGGQHLQSQICVARSAVKLVDQFIARLPR
jgi:hypothetical protein